MSNYIHIDDVERALSEVLTKRAAAPILKNLRAENDNGDDTVVCYGVRSVQPSELDRARARRIARKYGMVKK